MEATQAAQPMSWVATRVRREISYVIEVSNDGCRLFGQGVNQYAICPGTATPWLEECA